MNVARFIAKRYFKAKKSKNVINLITMISVVGITISTAALVILLSAFNGIEDMVIKLYSDFDPPITIRSAKSKTFNQHFIDLDQIDSLDEVSYVVRSVEEVVILKHEQKWVHAKMLGVDPIFVNMVNMNDHIVDGEAYLYENDKPLAIFGANLLDKLDGYVVLGGASREQITFHVPLREGRFRPGKNPLSIRRIDVAGRINYNRDVNNENVIIPYETAKELLQYEDDVSAIYIGLKEGSSLKSVKSKIQALVGEDFEVKTNFEKNELIFKTSQTERVIVFFILIFIFILSSFNLIASLAMLFVEKTQDISTLFSLGADRKMIFKIFFYEGLMISGRGVFFGLLLGYIIVFAQSYFGLLEMPGSGGEFFPMKPTIVDGLFIFGAVAALGFVVSYLPTKYLVQKHTKLNFNF